MTIARAAREKDCDPRHMRNAALLFAAVLLACASGPKARAAVTTITDCSGDSQLQSAVSSGGDIVFACSGTISTSLTISSSTTIDATGQSVALDGGGSEQVLYVPSGVTLTLNNLTIQNGRNKGGGGAIKNGGTLIVTNSTFVNNTAIGKGTGGGAIYNHYGTLTVANSTFVNNSATGSSPNGGAISSEGSAIITNSTFFNNSSQAGAIYNEGTMTLSNTILAGSGSGGNCAGAAVTDGGYNLSDDGFCGFTATGSQNNVANLNLGPLASNGGSTQTIAPGADSAANGVIPAGTNGCATTIMTDQTGAARPGDVNGNCSIGAYEFLSQVTTTITDCTDDSQLQNAVSAGGRIVFACSGTIPIRTTFGGTVGLSSDTTLDATGQIVALDGQKQREVFALGPGAALTLNNLTIQNGNYVGGGAIDNEGATLVLTNCTLSLNKAQFGGAIDNDYGTLVVANSTFSGNSAPGSNAQGGAIWNATTLTVANSTFSGNSAPGLGSTGGAIFNSNLDPVTVTNSTFSGNTAPSGSGGGIYNADGFMTVENTILAGNGGGDCAVGSGAITDGGYNLADDDSCGFRAGGSQNSVNPNLGALSYNGGPALTIPLNSGSAALGGIPFGSSGCSAISSNVSAMILTDERGVFRPQFTSTGALACDIGALQTTQNQIPVTFNTNPTGPSYTIGPSTYNSQQTLTLPLDTQSTIWTPSPQTGTGAQYTFASWSDGGTEAHQITILSPASGSVAYTANFNASYLLTTAVSPSNAGTVSVSASTAGSNGYYPANDQLSLAATANAGYVFSGWTGTASSASSPLNVTITGPLTETANFLLTQTITFNPIPNQVQGTTLTLTASASSGLAVSYTSSTPSVCTVSVSTATLVTPGTCTIVASQNGSSAYAAATSVSQSFTVLPSANFTITPMPASETVYRGVLAAFLLKLQSVNGFSGYVTLSCSGGPAGSKCADLPQTVHLKGTAEAISGILFPKTTPPGTYTMKFTGVSGSLTNSATAKFTVK